MTYTISAIEGVHEINMSFADEGVSLAVNRRVGGGPERAEAYVPTLERDARDNYRELFPEPVYEPGDMDMEGLE